MCVDTVVGEAAEVVDSTHCIRTKLQCVFRTFFFLILSSFYRRRAVDICVEGEVNDISHSRISSICTLTLRSMKLGPMFETAHPWAHISIVTVGAPSPAPLPPCSTMWCCQSPRGWISVSLRTALCAQPPRSSRVMVMAPFFYVPFAPRVHGLAACRRRNWWGNITTLESRVKCLASEQAAGTVKSGE